MFEDRKPDGRPESSGASGFNPHSFSWDPFERVRLALRRRPVSRKTAAICAVGLVSAVLAGATVIGSGGQEAAAAAEAKQKQLASLDADVARREKQVADLERRREAAQSEIADSTKRIAALETKRSDLQRQVAELTAPVAPTGGEQSDAPNDAAAVAQPDEKASAATDDASPPDEAPRGDIAASSRSGAENAAPSSAEVETASIDPAAAMAHAAGPLRVFIHVRSADRAARERARAVAAELERRGVTVAEIRGVLRPVRRDAVRYFYDADREAVSALQDAVRQASPPDDPAPQTQDFRGYRAPPRPGTLELWLS